MKQLTENLWQSTRYGSGILNSHAYLLTREQGNILFYNTGNDRDLLTIQQLGGITAQMLTHRDEASNSLSKIRQIFSNELVCSELEAPHIKEYATPDKQLPSRDSCYQDIEVLFTPGHSDGSISFYYQSPHGENYLFSGDTLSQSHGEWFTLVLKNYGGSKQQLINSLEKYKKLRPDYVFGSGFVGDVAFQKVTEASWLSAIENAQYDLGG